MKKQNETTRSEGNKRNDIPPLDIIDLDSGNDIQASSLDEEKIATAPIEDEDDIEGSSDSDNPSARDKLANVFSKVNIHIVFLILVVVLIIGIVYKFSNIGVLISQDDIFSDGMGTYDNSYDMMLPVFDANGDPVYPDYGQDLDILFFGNAPFADDRDSEDGLANMIQRKTGATIYNCSVGNSYQAALNHSLIPDEEPLDAVNFYWLCHVLLSDDSDGLFLSCVENLDEDTKREALRVYETLQSIDLNDIEVISIMYDGSDYLAGLGMYDDESHINIETFTGNLDAGIELIRENYPHIRFIVMSPTYTYGIDEDGNYISSDIQTYGQHYLSTYVIKQAEACSALSVTYIDHLYGTISEANATQCLSDNLHLNPDGRQLVADRFIKALYYYQGRN